jgi:hypothetical protein
MHGEIWRMFSRSWKKASQDRIGLHEKKIMINNNIKIKMEENLTDMVPSHTKAPTEGPPNRDR